MPLARFARLGPTAVGALLVAFATSYALGKQSDGTKKPPAPRSIKPADVEAVADSVFAAHTATDFESAAVIVFDDGHVIFQKAYGFAKPDEKVPADPDRTVYNVGSNSKLFVASAALQLKEQGKLKLDEDINHYLKSFQVPAKFDRPVTMADLLTHAGGIEDRMLGRTAPVSDGQVMTLGEFFRRFPPRRVYAPGYEMNYSGTGMALAACVIEDVSGMTFDRYCEVYFFDALGMTNTSFRQPIPQKLLEAQASPPDLPLLITYPVGGLASTAADMARFLMAHLRGGALGSQRILQPASAAEMHERHFSPAPEMPAMAYGFIEGTINGRRVLYHGGSRHHISLSCICPAERIGFFEVVAGARNEEVAAPITDDFFVRFFNRFFPRQPQTTQLSSVDPLPTLARFTGDYCGDEVPSTTIEKFFVGMLFSESDARVTIDPAEKLFFHPPMAEAVPLTRIRGTVFRGNDGKHEMYVNFREGRDGTITGFTVSMAPLGVFSFSRRSPLTTQGFSVGILLWIILVFFTWDCVAFVKGARRLIRPRVVSTPPAPARLAHGLATLTAALALVGPIWFNVWGLQTSLQQMTGVPVVFYVIPAFFTAAAVVGLSLPFFLIRAWKERCWSIATRIHYSLVAATAVCMVPYLYHWNLLGISV
jgi:CubicO group peptidase (beta-lactamase class C family)